MFFLFNNSKLRFFKRVLSSLLILMFFFNFLMPAAIVFAQNIISLPEPGTMLSSTPSFDPTIVKGLTVHPENPFLFDFMVSVGDENLDDASFEEEARKLIVYFLSSLTIPEDEMWVNLSPEEKDRMIPESLGVTQLGIDMLSQDYVLKQFTASLFYPEENLGKEFWDRIYKKVYEIYGHTDVGINTFNKVWIVPDEAEVYENNGSVFVVKKHLKVMLEQDYKVLKKHLNEGSKGSDDVDKQEVMEVEDAVVDVMRKIFIPELEKEVNNGKHFAKIRQIFNSMILAAWYKKTLKDTILGQVYVDKNKTSGINVSDEEDKLKIYDQYMNAFRKGVFSYIASSYDTNTREVIPRKYFSGGIKFDNSAVDPDLLVVHSGDIQEQPDYVKDALLSSSEKPDKKVRAGLIVNEGESGDGYERSDKSMLGAVVESVEAYPGAGEHVALGLGEEFEVEVRVKVAGDLTKLRREDIIITLHTEVYSDSDDGTFIKETGEKDLWHDVVIPPEDIVFSGSVDGSSGYFTGKIKVNPKRTGMYSFKVNAKVSTQTDPVWAQGDNTTVQVALLPDWFKLDKIHPEYVFINDVKLLGFPLNWTGLSGYMDKTSNDTKKNLFMCSPFFPTSNESPFSPLSVYVLSPRLIDWNNVVDSGGTPLEKFRDFKSHAVSQRREAFEKYKAISKIQQYARLIQKHIEDQEESFVFGVNYNKDSFNNSDEIFEFLIYEQFVNLEQFYSLLKYQHQHGNYVVGDLPFYRGISGVMANYESFYLAHDGDIIDNPGFEGSPKVSDLASWDELEIQKRVKAGEKDPRLLPYEYWNTVFQTVFNDGEARINGWRIDAFHMYGRGSSKDGSRRLVWDTSLWDDTAKLFKNTGMFLMAEQLGGDGHAYYNFDRLGFFSNAFVLDLKTKSLNDLLNELANFSRGIAFTVVDTHDSARWAKEYFKMFEHLTDLYVIDPEDVETRNRVLRLAGPVFLGLTFLVPKAETASISLGAYATQGSVKREIRDETGKFVVDSEWGTDELGPVDLSPWVKKFSEIREQNPAISKAAGIRIYNNDNERLASIAKTHGDNKLLIVGNFYKESKTIELSFLNEFGLSRDDVVVLKNLVDPDVEIEVEHGQLHYELDAGEIAVFRLESVKKAESIESINFEMNEPLEQAKQWDWDGNKNKMVMVHPNEPLVIDNQLPFDVHIIEEKTGKEIVIKSRKSTDGNIYRAVLKGLDHGNYAMTLYWRENDVWEGEGGVKRYYHFTVLPDSLQESKGLTIRLNRKDLDTYPHNTVTLSNGIGSVLRIPIRPLNREEYDGGIRVGGYVSKYDGFLVNLLKKGTPDESKRVVYRGTVDDVAVTFADGTTKSFSLDTTTFDHFERYPMPSWTFVIKDDSQRLVIEKTAVVKQQENEFAFHYKIVSATSGVESAELFVRPEVDQRLHHETTTISQDSLGWWAGKQNVVLSASDEPIGFVLDPINDDWRNFYPGFEGVRMYATAGKYNESNERHYSYNPLEGERGEEGKADYSDNYSPGYFNVSLKAGEHVSIVFSSLDVNTSRSQMSEDDVESLMLRNTELIKERLGLIKDLRAKEDPFVQKLVIALWEFIVERDEFYTVIAGHPWFSDWGRDTFIAFDGVLAAGMDDVALGLIKAFGKFEGKDGNKGMLPNIINGAVAGNWDTVDAPLLYILSVRNYIESTNHSSVLKDDLEGRTIQEILESIVDGYIQGTKNGIKMDERTGLVYSPAHYTWMDTNYPAATPREGYTVENNARWYEVLVWLSEIYKIEDSKKSKEYLNLAEKVKENFNRLFWYEEGGYLADTINASAGVSAEDGFQDTAIRPNQLIAVSSKYGLLSKNRKILVAKIVEDKLLVPTGLRTLSEDTRSSDEFPYAGVYEGSDDHGRKQAYHNGTVWPHLFGDWALAYVIAHDYSAESVSYVLPYFALIENHLKEAGVGSVSEVRDGNFPHRPRGTDAQAWSVAVNLAAYMKIKYGNIPNLGLSDENSDLTPGGIDFNSGLMKLRIRHDYNGMPLPLSQQPINGMQIQGFFPIIINVSPINISDLFAPGY